MLTLLRQELYKQIHGWFYIGWGIVILALSLIAGFLYTSNHYLSVINNSSSIFNYAMAGVLIAMIVFSSTIINSDFYNNTVKYLFARQFSRLQIFISKIITTILMYVYLIILAFVGTGISNVLFNHNRTFLFNDMFIHLIARSFYLVLMIPLVILISNIFRNNGVSIAIGIVFYFVTNIINSILAIFMDKLPIIKFNPLNFLNVYGQYLYPHSPFTKLSLTQIETGAVVWGIVFLVISYLVYNHRNV